MVHRPPDSRLLVALATHEGSYHKHLLALLDVHSQQALSSLAAYASATPPAVARGIMGVAGSLAGADEALRKYAAAEQQWRDSLEDIRVAEEDVTRIMRDRDILVTRLIKVSKSQKPTRDSFIASISPASPEPSTSSASLTSPVLVAGSTKLSAAQAELQACEAALAQKELALDRLRVRAVRDGLEARCRAMVECGWAWGEMGKEGLRALADFGDADALEKPLPHPSTSVPNGNGHAGGSDLSSLGPSQSASQTFLASPEQLPSRPTSPVPVLNIPPAHAISEFHHPPMERRITEESLRDLNRASQDEPPPPVPEESSSDDDDEDGDHREIQIVENKPFARATSTPRRERDTSPPAHDDSPRKRFPFRTHTRIGSASTVSVSPSQHTPGRDRERKGSFLSGIASLFRHSPSRAESPYGSGRWKTRTETNLRAHGRHRRRGTAATDDDSDDSDVEEHSRARNFFRRRVSEDSYAPPLQSLPSSQTMAPPPLVSASQPSHGGSSSPGPGARRAPPTGKLRKPQGRKRVDETTGAGTGEEWMSDGAAGSGVGERAKRASVKRRGDLSAGAGARTSDGGENVGAGTGAGAAVRRASTMTTTVPSGASVKRTPTTSSVGIRRQQKRATWSASTAPVRADAGRGESLMALVEDASAAPSAPSPSLFLPTAPPPQSGSAMFLPSAAAYASSSSSPTLATGASASAGGMFLPSAAAYRSSPAAASMPVIVAPSAMGPARSTASDTGHSRSVAVGTSRTRSRSVSAVSRSTAKEATRTNTPPPDATTINVVRSSSTRKSIASGKGGTTASKTDSSVTKASTSLPSSSSSSSQARSPNYLHAPSPSSLKTVPNGSALPAAHVAQIHTPAHHMIASTVPLKSALRNRTPSPMTGSSSSPARPLSPPPPPVPSMPPALLVPRAPGRVVLPPTPDPLPPPASVSERVEDDAASVSSYETGNETFEDAEDGIANPEGPPPPPKTVILPPTPVLPNGAPLAQGNGSAVTLTHLVVPGMDDGPSSDLSHGTGSSSTADGAPTRRKSVRVSLQPTFSPTPPALEDEDDEGDVGAGRGGEYWSRGGKKNVATSHDTGSRWEGDGAEERWRDSSDEDETYTRARAALGKVKKRW